MGDWIKNPYVSQVDKFATSMEKLSHIFLRLEQKEEDVLREESEDLYQAVKERVCQGCHRKEDCLKQEGFAVRQMLHEIFCAVEDYGAELNVELKRSIQGRCKNAPRFLRNALEAYEKTSKNRLWNQKMFQSREGCAVQLDTFAQMIRHATVELAASIFEDEHLEKKLKNRFARFGLKLLSSVFFVTADGRYEIHVTAKVAKGECVATKDVVELVSDCVGREMILTRDERPVLGTEYCTLVCVEGMRFHTLQGIAKIGKGCEKISGDNFSMLEMKDGKKAMVLSDGMGAGEEACRESTLVVEMLEELLDAGFPKETALQMLNTALVMGREEVRFSTVDMCVFDLYQGTCELLKAGAPTTFIKRENRVDMIQAESLPVGVVPRLVTDGMTFSLEPGDIVVMVTDGILDALPSGEQERWMQKIIGETKESNLHEFAHRILEKVLVCSGEAPLDDMTVLAAGICRS